MELMLTRSATALQRAVIRLGSEPDLGPLSLELTVDPQVYLHAAELVQTQGFHGRIAPAAYKDARSVVWRQLDFADQPKLELGLSWLAIANARAHADYVATLTLRDARGQLVPAEPGSQNPTPVPGRIGPPDNPTDFGGLTLLIRRTSPRPPL